MSFGIRRYDDRLDERDVVETQALLSPFRERPIAVEPPEAAEARLRRLVPRLESYTRDMLVSQRRKRTWKRSSWLVAALATGVGAGLLYGRIDDPSIDGVAIAGELVKVGAMDERTVLSGNLQLNLLGQVETNSVGARISTKEGLALELGPKTSALVGRLGAKTDSQTVELTSGRIAVSVPKLGQEREFSVMTKDARVVVHGTRFSVEVDPDRPGTCVRVSEGEVSVHRASAAPVFVTGGQQYGCTDAQAALNDDAVFNATEPELEESDTTQPSTDAEVAAQRGKLRKQRQAPSPEGTLGEETKLLQAAVRAEQEGRLDQSRGHLRELLSRYPKSPLRAEARLMLGRLSARQE